MNGWWMLALGGVAAFFDQWKAAALLGLSGAIWMLFYYVGEMRRLDDPRWPL